jgi:hypothetical protein
MKKKISFKDNQDELLAYYAEGLLDAKDLKAVSSIIKKNPDFQEELFVQCEIAGSRQTEPLPEVPELLNQRVKQLVHKDFGLNIWNLVIRIKDEAMLSFKSNGILQEYRPPHKVAFRGPEYDPQKTIVIKKDFKSVCLQIEITRERSTSNRIVMYAQDLHTQYPANDLRITLKDHDTELESHVTFKGKTQFENVRNGQYTVDVSGPGKPIARITLEIIQE